MRSRTVVAALALWVGLADAASAIDLTGTWTDVKDVPCRSWAINGFFKKRTRLFRAGDSPLLIAQTGGALAMSWLTADGQTWAGFVSEDTRGVGRGLAYECGRGTPPDPTRVALSVGSMQIEFAETFPVNARGVSGRMVVRYRYVDSGVYFECKKVELERVDTANPDPAPCP